MVHALLPWLFTGTMLPPEDNYQCLKTFFFLLWHLGEEWSISVPSGSYSTSYNVQDSLPSQWIIQPQMSTVWGLEILLYLYQNNYLRDECIYTLLIISSISMNTQSEVEIWMVLTAVHVLITLRYNQLDHIFLCSISNQHLPNNAKEQHWFLGS